MEESPTGGSGARNPGRVRAARRAMFPEKAHDLLESLRFLLCEPTRAKIVRALMVAELTVGDIGRVIERGRSSTSEHLRILRKLRVVNSSRRRESSALPFTHDVQVGFW